jgi:hypothetical protein
MIYKSYRKHGGMLTIAIVIHLNEMKQVSYHQNHATLFSARRTHALLTCNEQKNVTPTKEAKRDGIRCKQNGSKNIGMDQIKKGVNLCH